jgi:hypothetical protein
MHTRPRFDRRLLAIYLDDHRAGAAGGSALAHRIADRYGADPGFEPLVGIRDDIDADVASLDQLRARFAVRGGHVKRLLALIGERLGRLKPNGRIVRRSPLSPVLELELLIAGVAAKGRLWNALMSACGGDQIAGADLRELRERADDQLERLGRLHAAAATAIDCSADAPDRDVLSRGGPGPTSA